MATIIGAGESVVREQRDALGRLEFGLDLYGKLISSEYVGMTTLSPNAVTWA
jgi:hypothetical protein